MSIQSTERELHSAFEYFVSFAHRMGVEIDSPDALDYVQLQIREGVTRGLANGALIYGKRAESMFAFVAASLGNVTLIKQEDTGSCYSTNSEPIGVPDYRVVLSCGTMMLVEVKNCMRRSNCRFRRSYLQSMQRYARLMGCPLKIAVFWDFHGVWTLTDAEFLERLGDKPVLEFVQAMLYNELGLFGDAMIGLRLPLHLEFDLERPPSSNSVGEEVRGNQRLTVTSDNCVVSDNLERSIAIQLAVLLFSAGRHGVSCRQVRTGSRRGRFEFFVSVEDHQHAQHGFTIVGALSEFASTRFKELTVREGKVKSIDAPVPQRGIHSLVPSSYFDRQDRVLKIWLMKQVSNTSWRDSKSV